MERGKIVVGVKADYKPWGFRDSDGSLVGMEIDMAREVADKMGVEIANMDIEISYDFAFLGARIIEEVALPFPEIRMTINLSTDATTEQLDQIKKDLARFCPVAKMIRNAGCNIVETWNVTEH